MTAKLQLITREEDWVALVPEWWQLWSRVPTATPFQSPAWLIPWWRAFAPGSLHVLAARQDGRLIGLAPFYADPDRRMLPIGIPLSDYIDLLIDPEAFGDAAVLLAKGIAGTIAAGATEWEMPELSPQAQALHVVPAAAVSLDWGEPCPVLLLGNGRDRLSGVPARQRRKLRMARHRAERAGGWTILPQHGAAGLYAFALLVRLHGARWASRGEPGVLTDHRTRAFHAAAIPALERAGMLAMLVCRIGDRTVGVYYGLRHRDRAYAYLGGFDPDAAAISPGTLLLGHAIEQAERDGMGEFHFLRGGEAYKYYWGATDRVNCRRLFRPLHAHAA